MTLPASFGHLVRMLQHLHVTAAAALPIAILALCLGPGAAVGDPLFAAPFLSFSAGLTPHSAVIGDLNGDGNPDLVTANAGDGTVSVLLGDGEVDLVTANSTSGTVSVLIDNGDGTFGARADFGTGRLPVCVAIGDLNGDGNPDLVTANHDANTVSVLINGGAGATDVGPGPTEPARALGLLAPRPNPCGGASEIRFALPAAYAVDLAVFDLAGRRVRSLAAGEPLPPGEHGIRWDGRDDSGAPVHNGICLVRLRAGREVAVRKLIVLR